MIFIRIQTIGMMLVLTTCYTRQQEENLKSANLRIGRSGGKRRSCSILQAKTQFWRWATAPEFVYAWSRARVWSTTIVRRSAWKSAALSSAFSSSGSRVSSGSFESSSQSATLQQRAPIRRMDSETIC